MSHGHTHKFKKKNTKRVLYTRDQNLQIYGLITKAMGNCTFEFENVNTGKVAITKTAGKVTRGPGKTFIKVGDIVLIEVIKITVNKDSYSIDMVYRPEEITQLRKMGELERVNNENEEKTVIFEAEAVNNAVQQEVEFDIDDI
jgi:translation initiation factor IF-1